MTHLLELAGKRFGRLLVIERAANTKRNSTQWLCRCDCGGTRIARSDKLRTGHVKSCGCWQREILAAREARIEAAAEKLGVSVSDLYAALHVAPPKVGV